MAALPLQGLAAASMIFCGAEISVASLASGDGDASYAHGEAAPAGAHDHAAHGHGSQGHAKSDSDASAGKAAQADQDQQGHVCALCASCCQVIALGGFEPLAQTSAAPGKEPTSPLVRIATRAATVLDKPPRV